MSRVLAPLLLAIALLGAAEARSATPSPAASTSAAPAASGPALIVADAFVAEALKRGLETGSLREPGSAAARDGALPEPLLRQALLEEFNVKRSVLVASIADKLEGRFSPRELEAGAVLFTSEAGRNLLARLKAGGSGRALPSVRDERVLQAWLARPGASGFARKLRSLEPEDILNRDQLLQDLMPGVLRRVADKQDDPQASSSSVHAAPPSGAAQGLARLLLPAVVAGIEQAELDAPKDLPAAWAPLFKAAMVEEVQANPDRVVKLLARGFERRFTGDELQAAAQLIATPMGQRMLAARPGAQPYAPTAEEQAMMARWLGTPGAGPFISKMATLKPDIMIDREQMTAELMPGVLRRFAEKIGAQPPSQER